MIDDVLIKVGEFIFLVDFIFLDTEPITHMKNQIPIILGCPFLATSNANINCRSGGMTLQFGKLTMELNIFDTGNSPKDDLQDPLGINWIELDNKQMDWGELKKWEWRINGFICSSNQ